MSAKIAAKLRPITPSPLQENGNAVGAPGAASGSAQEADGSLDLKHVAIIMDGNGRWAAARGLSRNDGHRAGVEAARRAVEAAQELGLTHVTLYSFSTENWRRPALEVRGLISLLCEFIGDDLPRLRREGVNLRVIGARKSLDAELRAIVSRAERETANNSRFYLQIAFNYGGRDEILRAARSYAHDVATGSRPDAALDEATFSEYLDTRAAPDPDLVIRTSGEKRISNFLLWQAAYAEFVFLDTLWPDFDGASLKSAIEEYRQRIRRYGGL
ncbi:MAG: polyprenyl diphosphate synthase [Pseudomonadota bacterium]